MNRRGFLASLAASAMLSLARQTRLAETTLAALSPEESQTYVEHLARSILETKETLAANILNKAFG